MGVKCLQAASFHAAMRPAAETALVVTVVFTPPSPLFSPLYQLDKALAIQGSIMACLRRKQDPRVRMSILNAYDFGSGHPAYF